MSRIIAIIIFLIFRNLIIIAIVIFVMILLQRAMDVMKGEVVRVLQLADSSIVPVMMMMMMMMMIDDFDSDL